jgi:hypothetical protein
MKRQRSQQASRSRFWILNLGCACVLCALWGSALAWGVLPYLQAASEARTQAAENYRLQHSLSALRKQEAEMRLEVRQLVDVLSKRYDIACPPGETLLDTFTRLIADHDLEMISFVEQTRGERSTDGQSIDVRLQGRYADVCAWLDALSRLSEPVRVVALQLSPTGQNGQQCQARAELTFYDVPLTLASRETIRK